MAPTLVRAIDRAVDLCRMTLDYARDEPPPPERAHFRLRDLVSDVGNDPAVAGDGEARVENRVPGEIEVEADRDQLYRVLVNLAHNAAEAGARHVDVGAGLADGCVSITVEDDGPGIPEKARAHMFEPFIGSARAGGTGLGLAIAREIMRAHGGDILLMDTSENGTTFRLDLPVTPAPPRT